MGRSTRCNNAMRKTRLNAAVLIALAATTTAAWSGQFHVVRDHYSTTRLVPLVAYEGEVTEGDAAKLRTIIAQFCPTSDDCEFDNTTAILSLNSIGGSFAEGIKLAESLRELRVATVVENGNVCHSACALAFLGGSGFHATGGVGAYVDRTIEPDARVGFHSPFTQKLAGLSGDQKLTLTVRGLRISIADLARFLLRVNVDPIVVDRIIMMDPDQYYYITTFADLFHFRVNLPEFPVHLADPSREKRIFNICSRLAALHYLDDFAAATEWIEDGFSGAVAKTENGVPLDGYNILDRPLNAAWCGLHNDPSPGYGDSSESYTVSFARMVWRDDLSDTYADPVLSFVYSADGWSSADYRGGTATRSVLRLGPLNHWLYDPEAQISILGAEARRFIEDDKRIDFTPFDLWRDNILTDRAYTVSGPGARLYEVDELRATVEARPASRFVHTRQRYSGLLSTRITFQQVDDDTFIVEGLKPDGRTGFLAFGLRSDDAGLITTLEYPIGADGRPSDQTNSLINRIACSAEFGFTRLPCS